MALLQVTLFIPAFYQMPSLLLSACSDCKHVNKNSLCEIFAILLGIEDVPSQSVRLFRIVKLNTYMPVKY